MSTNLLVIVKAVGLVATAGFSIAALFRRQEDSPELERQRRRWDLVSILVPLLISLTSEMIDTASKKEEASAAAQRAADAAEKTTKILSDLDRSLHPLFPLKIQVRFKITLDSPAFSSIEGDS